MDELETMDELKTDITHKLNLLTQFGYNPVYNSSMSYEELLEIYDEIIDKIQKDNEYRSERSNLINISLYLMSIFPNEKIFKDIIQSDWSNDEIKEKLRDFLLNHEDKETLMNKVNADMISMFEIFKTMRN